MRFAVSFLVAMCLVGRSVPAAERPNVVLIVGDDQAYGDFGFMKHPAIRTPNLDRLAAESLAFTRGYVPSSLCRPSLASIITGLYAHQHGITSNDPPLGLARDESLRQRRRQIDRIEAVATLPRVLGKQGYVSLQTGKWWEGDFRRGGFTEGMTHGDPTRGGRHGDEGLKIGRQGVQPVFDFIDRAGGHPFFVWYAPMLPHQPHNPPERLLAKYRDMTPSLHAARYWAMCEWFDETCGQLLDYLDRKKLAEKTLVAFVVDNGWIQDPKADRFAPKSKRSPYDGGLRTPILVRWPGRIAPRRDDATLALSIDLAPTILAACGVEPPDACQGISLLDRERLAKRKIVCGETFDHNAVDIDRPASSLEFRWCTDGRWKLIVPARGAGSLPADKAPELYDLAADPHETLNLAPTLPQEVKRLRTALDAWWPGE